MNYWNYRVVQLGNHVLDDEAWVYGICEVHYDENDKPVARTEPVPVIGEQPAAVLKMMQQALLKPFLKEDLTEL